MSNWTPSVTSSSVDMVLLSSTVMTPSLPTRSNASPISSPTSGSCAEIVATPAIDARSSTGVAAASSGGVHGGDRGGHAAAERDRVGAGGDVAQALVHQRLRQHGRGRGAVTGDVVGLGGDVLRELRAEVLVGVVEVDLTGDGHAVVGDRRRAELLVDDDVAAARAEGHLDRVGELVDAALEGAPGVLVELDDLGHAGPLVEESSGGRRPPRDPRRSGARGGRSVLVEQVTEEGHFSTTASRSRAERTR